MFSKMKIVCMVLTFLHLKQDAVLAEAYIKSLDGKPPFEENAYDHPSNQIPLDEVKPKFVDQHHYYLPLQTTFGSTLSPSTYGASITSPPHISPASVHSSYEQNTYTAIEEDLSITDDYITPYLSQCVSETPLSEKLESQVILSSKEILSKSMILSGHPEIVSKTSNEGDVSKISEMVSESLVPLRTHVYMPSVTDL